MHLVGMTGGIGSGKSSVSAQLADGGAVIIDADAIVRELQEPGQPVLLAMVDRWGPDILLETGALDRAKVAGIVFGDRDQLKELEAIVHPVLQEEIKRRIAEQAETDHVVVLDMALLAERGRDAYDVQGVLVVDCPPAITVSRLVEYRGFTEEDAIARISNQVSRDQRLAVADYVIDNSGTPEELANAVDACVPWLQSL